MHVCIDYRPALREATGVGTYVRGLLSALLRAHPEVDFSAFSASWRDRLELEPPLAAARAVDARVPVRLLDWLWHRRAWPPLERWTGPLDVAHSPSPLPLPTSKARTVVTVHDCHFLRHPDDVSGVVRRDYVPLVRQQIGRADAIVAVSETTRQELLELLGIPSDRVQVTYNGVEDIFAPVADARTRVADAFALDRPFLLFAGRREPRKDMPTLLAGFEHVLRQVPDVDLVLVGPAGAGWDRIWATTPDAVRARVRILPHQPAAALAALYSAAELLLLPSRWEGFGLTAIEAMACGTPVVAARTGALPEILADAAAWFTGGDAEAMADRCVALLEQTEQAAEFIARGRQQAALYSWDRTAGLTCEVYERVLSC